MKIIVNQKELATAVKLLQRVLPKKNNNPILTMFHLRLKEGILTLKTTDLMTGLEIVLKVDNEVDEVDEGEWMVSGKVFSEAILMLDKGETAFDFDNDKLKVKNGTDRVVISLVSDGDFPELPRVKGIEEKMEIGIIEEIANKIVFATSPDISRPQLTGVDLRFNDKQLSIVGTDGFRLSILEVENFSQELIEGEEILLSAKCIGDLLAIVSAFGLSSLKMSYDAEEKKLLFKGKNFLYQASLIAAAFPPYERIIPLEFQTEIEVNREELLQMLNKAAVFARESSNVVKIDFGDKEKARIVARGVNGEYEGEIEILRMIGQGPLIAFNLKYLTDYLGVIDSETLWLGINEANKPVLLAEEKESNFRYIVMPFKAHD